MIAPSDVGPLSCYGGTIPVQQAAPLVVDIGQENNVMRAVLFNCGRYFVSACLFSMVINLLYLSPTIYMLQISDRVMASGSKETLVLLTLAYIVATLTLAALDAVRSMVLIRAGLRLDRLLAVRLMGILLERANLHKATLQKRDDALRTLDRFRQFITGPGIHALFDLPWLPIYLGVLALIHPILGVISIAFMLAQVILAIVGDKVTDRRMALAGSAAFGSYTLADAALRNAEVVVGMGMSEAILAPWHDDRRAMLTHQAVASDRNALLTAIGKFLRLLVQALMVAIGAWLALDHVITPGGMFAAMLLIGRATQPLDQMIGLWKQIGDARAGYRSLNQLLNEPLIRDVTAILPEPTGVVTLERVAYVPPKTGRAVVIGVSFSLEPGDCLGVIGPTASGKSTLARLVVGVHAPSQGTVRLDGADVYSWNRNDFGRHVGYLPQDVELFAGTVAQNISRFTATDAQEAAGIIEAARLAGAHDMILKLSKGYDTPIGEHGAILSGGQRQQIGLARAVFGHPRLIVLDEPDANLDTEGELALARCLETLKRNGTTVLIVSHRPGVLAHVDRILYLDAGQMRAIIERNEFFARMNAATRAPAVVS